MVTASDTTQPPNNDKSNYTTKICTSKPSKRERRFVKQDFMVTRSKIKTTVNSTNTKTTN